MTDTLKLDNNTLNFLVKNNFLSKEEVEKAKEIFITLKNENIKFQEYTIKNLIEDFELFLKKEKGELTVYSYTNMIKQIMENLLGSNYENKKILDFVALDESDIVKFLIDKNHSGQWNKNTIKTARSCLNLTYRCIDDKFNIGIKVIDRKLLNNEGLISINGRFYLSNEEMEKFFNICSSSNKFLFYVMYYVGLDRDDATAIKYEDINLKGRELKVYDSICKKERHIQLTDDFIKRYEEHIKVLKNDYEIYLSYTNSEKIKDYDTSGTYPVFPSNIWNRMSKSTFNRTFKKEFEKYFKQKQLKAVIPYKKENLKMAKNVDVKVFKNSKRMFLYEQGYNEESISEMVGDFDIVDTQEKIKSSIDIENILLNNR